MWRVTSARCRLRGRRVRVGALGTRRNCHWHRRLTGDDRRRPCASEKPKGSDWVRGRGRRASAVCIGTVRYRGGRHDSLLCQRSGSGVSGDRARAAAWRSARHRRVGQMELLVGGTPRPGVVRLGAVASRPVPLEPRAKSALSSTLVLQWRRSAARFITRAGVLPLGDALPGIERGSADNGRRSIRRPIRG